MEEELQELRSENKELKNMVDEYEDLVEELRKDISSRDNSLQNIKNELDGYLLD